MFFERSDKVFLVRYFDMANGIRCRGWILCFRDNDIQTVSGYIDRMDDMDNILKRICVNISFAYFQLNIDSDTDEEYIVGQIEASTLIESGAIERALPGVELDRRFIGDRKLVVHTEMTNHPHFECQLYVKGSLIRDMPVTVPARIS